MEKGRMKIVLMGDDGRSTLHGRPLLLDAVAAKALAELLEILGVRIGRGLLAA